MKIGARSIGGNSPCYIVAELGINHNGDLDIAKTQQETQHNHAEAHPERQSEKAYE